MYLTFRSMKVYLTRQEAFTGKKNGVKYVKYSYITPTGETETLLTTADKAEAFAVSSEMVASPSEIGSALSDLPAVDIEFDRRGYLVGVKKV